MAKKILFPTIISAAGNKPKIIEEYIGLVNSNNSEISIARMKSPAGWIEPGQKPEFDEFTIVLKGSLKVKTISDEFEINAGEAIVVNKNEWIQYSTPGPEGAEYIAICLPAFSPDTVHRDE
jgi:mannose-6-phosphate isomerase-like protein (cupin superfamily)